MEVSFLAIAFKNYAIAFLSDEYYKAEMTPEKSLYDLASGVFAADQVMLPEHFQCVPAIIAYSNHEFYSDQIRSLRIQKASERIDPPLVILRWWAGREIGMASMRWKQKPSPLK